MEKSQTQTRWSATSPSFLISAALAAFMLFLGVRGLFAPQIAAHGFGFGLVDPGDAVWLQIKGDRDVSAAFGMIALLALRWRRALGVLLLSSIVAPLLDCIISLATPGHDTALALGMHGGAAMLVAVLGIVLFRGQSASPSNRTEMSSATTASATR